MTDDPILGSDPLPTPPSHPLVIKSELLDRKIENDPFFNSLKSEHQRMARIVRRNAIVTTVLMVVILVVIYALVQVSKNTAQLEQEKRARHVFCLETNIANAQARNQLVAAFPDPATQQVIQDLGAKLFPQRDCLDNDFSISGTVITSSPGLGDEPDTVVP